MDGPASCCLGFSVRPRTSHERASDGCTCSTGGGASAGTMVGVAAGATGVGAGAAIGGLDAGFKVGGLGDFGPRRPSQRAKTPATTNPTTRMVSRSPFWCPRPRRSASWSVISTGVNLRVSVGASQVWRSVERRWGSVPVRGAADPNSAPSAAALAGRRAGSLSRHRSISSSSARGRSVNIEGRGGGFLT